MSSKPIFYYDDFVKKGHTTVKLMWTPTKNHADTYIQYEGDQYKIFTGFIKNDLSIQIQNTWGSITSIVDSFLSGVGLNTSDLFDRVSRAYSSFKPVSTATGIDSSQLSDFANSKLVNFTDYVKKYQGTDINFPNNIDMLFIADELGKDPRIEARNIIKFIMGGFETEVPSSDIIDQQAQEGATKPVSGSGIGKFFSNTYGLLRSPGEYEYDPSHDFRNPDLKMKGTLSLFIGNSLQIHNLLVDSVDMTVSKAITTEGYPLYVMVSLALSPSAFFSAAHLHKMLGGDGKWDQNWPMKTLLDNDPDIISPELVSINETETKEEILARHRKNTQISKQIISEIKKAYDSDYKFITVHLDTINSTIQNYATFNFENKYAVFLNSHTGALAAINVESYKKAGASDIRINTILKRESKLYLTDEEFTHIAKSPFTREADCISKVNELQNSINDKLIHTSDSPLKKMRVGDESIDTVRESSGNNPQSVAAYYIRKVKEDEVRLEELNKRKKNV